MGDARRVGSPANIAPFTAPIEVPTIRSGVISASASAAEHADFHGTPLSAAPQDERHRHRSDVSCLCRLPPHIGVPGTQ